MQLTKADVKQVWGTFWATWGAKACVTVALDETALVPMVTFPELRSGTTLVLTYVGHGPSAPIAAVLESMRRTHTEVQLAGDLAGKALVEQVASNTVADKAELACSLLVTHAILAVVTSTDLPEDGDAEDLTWMRGWANAPGITIPHPLFTGPKTCLQEPR